MYNVALGFAFVIRILVAGFMVFLMVVISESLTRKHLDNVANNGDKFQREREATYFYMNTVFSQTVLILIFMALIEVFVLDRPDINLPLLAGICMIAIRGFQCIITEMASEVNTDSQKGLFKYRKYTSGFSSNPSMLPAWFIEPVNRFMKKQLWISVIVWIACRIVIGLVFYLIR